MINVIPRANLYPTETGLTLGDYASGGDEYGFPASIEAGTAPEVSQALAVGGQASPIVGFIVFVVLAAVITFIATRYKKPDEAYSNIRGSAYNILFISLVAVAGLPVWKFLFTKFKVPGVSTWVHAA